MILSKEMQQKINENKREQLIDAQFALMKITGKISGNVKDVLYLEEKEERKEKIREIRENLEKLIEDIYIMSDALRLDFDKIIKK